MDYSGRVKWYSEEKKYGFLLPDDGSEDVFVHERSLLGLVALPKGTRVTYDLEPDRRTGRIRAANVRLLD